ncbi:MAG: TATA-box-binding protein [Promethearchaeota archaeon]|nr:MAG: TATA-box-binding protein [Candidatus Lokiarchaeota archaeon]
MDDKVKLKKEDIEYKVDNIVATVTLEIDKKIDLVHVARKFIDSEYNPERFPGIVLRVPEPKATFLIFSTGKMVVTGSKTENKLKKAVTKVVKDLKSIDIKIEDYTIKIENFVASGGLNKRIDLNLATIMMEYSLYEPEIFPGLIYYMRDPKASFLIFSNGNFVCTGVKHEHQIAEAIFKLKDVIQENEIYYKSEEKSSSEEIVFI